MTQAPVQEQGPEYWRRRAGEVALEQGLDPGQFTRLIGWESSFSPTAGVPGADYGIAQINAIHTDVNRADPEESLAWAARYVKAQYSTFGDWRQAYAAYAGPGWVQGLVEQYGADWEQYIAGSIESGPKQLEKLNYIFGGPASEAALATPRYTDKSTYQRGLISGGIALAPRSPFADIPDYFTGYRDLLDQKLDELKLLGGQVETSHTGLMALQQESAKKATNEDIYRWYEKQGWTRDDVNAQGVLSGYSEEAKQALLQARPWLSKERVQAILGQMPSWEDARKAVQDALKVNNQPLVDEQLATLDKFIHEQAVFTMMQALPFLIASDEVKTVDDALNWFQTYAAAGKPMGTGGISTETMQTLRTGVVFNQQDREFFSYLIQNLSPALDLSPDITADEVMAALATKNRPTPRVMTAMTADQIHNMLFGVGKPFEMPGDTTEPELRAFFRRRGMSNEEYLETVAGAKKAASDLALAWFGKDQAYLMYREGIMVPDIPNASRLDQLKQVFTQPGMAAADALGFLREEVSKPFATMGVLGLSQIGQWMGLPPLAGTESIERSLRNSDEGFWDSLSEAYDDWDAPGAAKFAAEVGFDPTTYLGFGLFTKATKGIPLLGPIVGAMERGWVKAWDIPFTVIGKGYRTIVPKTLEQIAAEHGDDAVRDVVALYTKMSGRQSVEGLDSAAPIGEAVTKGVLEFIQSPGRNTGPLWERAASLVSKFKRLIPESEVTDWAKQLGGKNPITRQVVHDINIWYSRLYGSGVHGFLKSGEVAQLTLKAVGADETAVNLAKATALVARRVTDDTSTLGKLFAGRPADAYDRVAGLAEKIFTANARSDMWEFAEMSGFSVSLAKLASGPLMWNPLMWLDKFVTRPVASSYLLFIGYGPLNYIESVFRVGKAGFMPRFGAGHNEYDFVRRSWGYLRNSPDEIIHRITARPEIAILPNPGETGYRVGTKMGLLPGITRELPLDSIPILNKVPRALRSIQNFNDFWSRVSTYQRAMYIHKQMLQQLHELAPGQMKIVGNAIRGLKDLNLQSLSKGELNELGEYLVTASIHSPDSVSALRTTAEKLQARKYVNDLRNVLAEHHEIESPFADAIVQAANRGELTSSTIDSVINRTFAAVQDTFMGKLPARAAMLRDRWVPEMTQGTEAAIKPGMSKSEARRAFREVANIQESAEDVIETHYRTTTTRAHGLKDVEEKDALHTASYTDSMEFSDTYEDSVGTVLDSLRANVTQVFDEGAERTNMLRILDNLGDQYRVTSKAWRQRREIAEEFIIGKKGKARDWNGFYTKVEAMWTDWHKQMVQLKEQYQAAAMLIDPGPIGQISPSVGKLTPVHVARLFASTGDDLSRGLVQLETMTVMTKQSFIEKVHSRANVLAMPLGSTANDLGFTEPAIGRVYDQLMAKLKLDPSIGGVLEPIRQGLEGVRASTHELYAKRGIPQSDVDKLNGFFDEVATTLKGSGLFQQRGVVQATILPRNFNFRRWQDLYDEEIDLAGAMTIKDYEELGPRDFVAKYKIDLPGGTWVIDSSGTLDRGFIDTISTREYLPEYNTLSEDLVEEWKGIADELGLLTTAEKRLTVGVGADISPLHYGAIMRGVGPMYIVSNPLYHTLYARTLVDDNIIRAEDLAQYVAASMVETAKHEVAHIVVPFDDQVHLGVMRDMDKQYHNVFSTRSAYRKAEEYVERWVSQLVHDSDLYDSQLGRISDEIIAKVKGRVAKTRPAIGSSAERALRGTSGPDFLTQRGRVGLGGGVPGTGKVGEGGAAVPGVPKGGGRGPGVEWEATPEWSSLREQAMDQARLQYERDFTQYTRQNAFDAYMRRLFPFWTYESQRWTYLARLAVTHPGIMTGWGKYMDYSDTGYIPLGDSDLQINPFRGTIFMGGFRRFYQRDYPEYQDRMGLLPGVLDYIGRAGFYPGIHTTLPMALFGGKEMQTGELLPSFMRSGLSGMVGLNIPGAKHLQDMFFPDRFRDYQTSLAVSEMAEERGLDINGPAITRKMRMGQDLTPDEQRLWDEAGRRINRLDSVLFQTTGMFRFAPEERAEAWQAVAEMREALTGVSIADQEKIRELEAATGNDFSDYFPLDPLDQDRLNQLDAYQYWVGTSSPLIPDSTQRLMDLIGSYWEVVGQTWDTARTQGFQDKEGNVTFLSLSELDAQFRAGDLSAKDYTKLLGDTIDHTIGLVEGLGQDPQYKDVPKTLKERLAFYDEHNIPVPTFSPGQELTWMYYELSPKLTQDEEGNYVYDFTTYYAQVDAIMDAMPDQIKARFLEYVQRDWTPTQQLYWQVSRDFMRPYRNLRDTLIEQYPEDQQKVLRQYTHAEGAELEALKAIEIDGQHLIAGFESKLRLIHENYRDISPETDAWLYFWGKTGTLRSKEAEVIYADLMHRFRPGAIVPVQP